MTSPILAGPLAFLLALGSPAAAADGARAPAVTSDPNLPSCLKATAAEVGRFVGHPARVRESNVNSKGAGVCIWTGSQPGLRASVTFLPAPSLGVQTGQERAYFDQTMQAKKAQNKQGELTEVSGPWDSAWALRLAEKNDDRFFQVYIFKSGDWMTIETFGMPFEDTTEIARLAGSRM